MDHKRQHWIPKGYLKAWCDATVPEGHDPYVWQFTKDGTASRKKAPKKIFYEPNLYTLHLSDGTRDLKVEHGLAGLEDRFVRVRDTKLTPGRSLTAEEHVVVCAFVAAMKCRTPVHLNHWRSNWETIAQRGHDLQAEIEAGESVPKSVSTS